jgi:hypothetical protein
VTQTESLHEATGRLAPLVPAIIAASAFGCADVLTKLTFQAGDELSNPAVAVINEDRFGSQTALCVATGDTPVQQGPRKIPATEVWVGEGTNLRRLNAGLGSCDPAWSPERRVAGRAPPEVCGYLAPPPRRTRGSGVAGGRALGVHLPGVFASKWSADGDLVALLVSNGGTSWVDVFRLQPASCSTSPPRTIPSPGTSARGVRLGDLQVIRLPVSMTISAARQAPIGCAALLCSS